METLYHKSLNDHYTKADFISQLQAYMSYKGSYAPWELFEEKFIDYVGVIIHGEIEVLEDLSDNLKEELLKSKSSKDENNLTGTHVIIAFSMLSPSKLKIYGIGENKIIWKGPLMIGFVCLVYIA